MSAIYKWLCQEKWMRITFFYFWVGNRKVIQYETSEQGQVLLRAFYHVLSEANQATLHCDMTLGAETFLKAQELLQDEEDSKTMKYLCCEKCLEAGVRYELNKSNYVKYAFWYQRH